MTTPVVTVTDLIQGPVSLFTALFGATEPPGALSPVDTNIWTPAGGTQEGLQQVVNQTFADMEVDEVHMDVDTRLTKIVVQMATALAEHRLDNYRLAFNLPKTGTNEVQTIGLGTATAGTVTITFNGQTTTALPFNAPAATIQNALEQLSNVDPGDVAVTGGPWPAVVNLTWGGRYAATDIPAPTVTPTGLTGGTATVNTTTTGAPGPKIGLGAGTAPATSPLMRAVLARGAGPSGLPRQVIVRRCISRENVQSRYSKANQSYLPITWQGYWVSKTLDAFIIDDTQL